MKLVAWDTETHLIAPGDPAPRMVCATEAGPGGEAIHLRAGLGKGDAVARFRELLEDPTVHLGGTNFVFDLAVHCVADPDVLPLIFKALDAGRLHSTDILEALHDNALGRIYKEPTGAPIGRYSQALLEARYLGIDRSADKHGPDVWRTRYVELDGVPFATWPQAAVDYPLADARGALGILSIQLGLVNGHPSYPRENLQCEADEMRAAFALHLSTAYGMRTDGPLVAQAVGDMHIEHERSRREFFGAGIVRIKTAGKDETPDTITLDWVRGALGVLRDQIQDARAAGKTAEVEWRARRIDDLITAERALGRGRGLKWATDTRRLGALVSEAYHGSPPLTDTGKVSTSRDTLVESGDEVLEGYGEAGPNEKLLSTYAEVLQQGTEVPINASVLSLVASARTSYSRPNLQNLPRGGAVRECFVPRDGWVFVSVDYAALELATLAQVCFTWFGESAMRDAINQGQDLHTRLAARIAGGLGYEEAMRRLKAKDPGIKNLRQASKPVNFGLPGLMGAPKLVLTARKQDVRFCELAGVSARCADNARLVTWKGRTIAPTCSKCLELAVEYARLWREEWPEMAEYLALTPALADRGEPVPSLGNGMLRLDPSAGAISNHFFQNLAAQGAKSALWKVTRECLDDPASVLYGNLRPVVFVHDEIISEVREEYLDECAARQAEIMVTAMRVYTPDVAIRAEPAAARRWFKGMEKVDQQGRLRPWWPPDAGKPWAWGPDQDVMTRDLAS